MYWNKYVAEGWGEGERQANEIFLNDLGRLQRDITGMARYRVLLHAGVVANPRVATKQQAVDGGGSELRAGDPIVTITSQPGLQANAGVWRGARRTARSEAEMLDIPFPYAERRPGDCRRSLCLGRSGRAMGQGAAQSGSGARFLPDSCP